MEDGRTWEDKWDDGHFEEDEQCSSEKRKDIWESHPEDTRNVWIGEEEDLWLGETVTPDLLLMSESLVPYENSKPSNLIANQWVCPSCFKRYNGSYNYISDVQEYECIQCQRENPSAYDWTLIRCRLNEVSLEFSRVHNQWGTHQCLLYAFFALCDMMRKVRGARFGYDEETKFDAYGMNWNYERFAGCRVGEISDIVRDMLRRLEAHRHPTIELMLLAACYYGVPYVDNTLYHLQSCDQPGIRVPQRTLNVKSWFRVPGHDISTITRLIGQGIPLLAVVPLGKLFKYLAEEDIYYAPDPDGCITHVVVLHGSGVAMPQGSLSKLADLPECSIPEVYYRCRNSHSSNAHPSIAYKRKKGSDFKIWARHIVGDVYGINLADVDN